MEKEEKTILEEYFSVNECEDGTLELESWTNGGVELRYKRKKGMIYLWKD